MAKTMSKFQKRFLERRAIRHQELALYLRELTPANQEHMESKLAKKLASVALRANDRALRIESAAGIQSPEMLAAKQATIDAIRAKYSLKLREVKQQNRRSLEMRKVPIPEFDKRLAELEVQREEEIRALDMVKNPDKQGAQAKAKAIRDRARVQAETLQSKTQKKMEAKSAIANANIQHHEQMADKIKTELAKTKTVSLFESKIPSDVLLRLDNLSMHFGGLKAVDHLSFDVKKGEIFGLIGPNGAGKTTVFNCITRFYKATEGNIYYRRQLDEAVVMSAFKVHNVIRQGIVRTFQNVELVWELNVVDNLLVAAHTLYRSTFFGHLFHSQKIRHEELVMRKKAEKILFDLGLAQYMYMYPLGLPYGILKKVELARTLMAQPRLIILDEPAAGLNDTETEELAQTIRKIRDEYNTTIFLVEHDMGLVMDICDTVCAISFGKRLAIGTPEEIQASSVVREAYLGGE